MIRIILFSLLCPGWALACTCMAYSDDPEIAVTQAFSQAHVVFLGEVTTIRNKGSLFVKTRQVIFSVKETWKGSAGDEVMVNTNDGEIACGYPFRARRTYLVFAHRGESRGVLTTSLCDLNRTQSKARGLMPILDQLEQSASK